MKYFMFMLIFLIMFSIPTKLASADKKQKINIAIIHSYDLNHACTFPQNNGILNALFSYDKENINVREFLLKAKTQNVKRTDQEKVATALLNELSSRNFDYYFTTDDLAFELIAIPLLKQNKKVLSSGLNKPFIDYQREFRNSIPTNNLIICEEWMDISELMSIFNEIKFRPTKWFILYDDTETSFYMLQNYEKELAPLGAQIVPIKVNNINNLEKIVVSLQKEQPSILVVTLQTLYDDQFNIYVSKERFVSIIKKYNKVHLEITGNSLYSKFGFAISSGPDFEDMGKLLANKLITILNGIPWKHELLKPKTKTGVNKKRLEELDYEEILNTKINVKVY